MNKHVGQPVSILHKVAGAMHQMGVSGLPRNYELVYEAMSGTRPELTRDFLALGDDKSQAALDELGRKYLPHHHEHDVLNRSSDTVRDELHSFMNLVRRETSSLTFFGNLIDETSRQLTKGGRSPDAVDDAVRTIAAATARKVAEGHDMADEASEQSSRLGKVAGELNAFEARKYVDTLTGLANRRAFNRKLIELYETSDADGMTGIAICDIDNFAAINQRYDCGVGDKFIRHVARIIQRHMDHATMAARIGGGQFGFMFDHAGENAIVRLAEQIRAAIMTTPLVNALNNVSFGCVTLSFGICMREFGPDASHIVDNALSAVQTAKTAGRNRTHVYAPLAASKSGADWMLYRV